MDTGLDVHLIPMCHSALADRREDVEPVYLEMEVQNTHRCACAHVLCGHGLCGAQEEGGRRGRLLCFTGAYSQQGQAWGFGQRQGLQATSRMQQQHTGVPRIHVHTVGGRGLPVVTIACCSCPHEGVSTGPWPVLWC